MDLGFKLEFGFNHLWAGLYWETYRKYVPFDGSIVLDNIRTDIWLAIPFIALRIIYVR